MTSLLHKNLVVNELFHIKHQSSSDEIQGAKQDGVFYPYILNRFSVLSEQFSRHYESESGVEKEISQRCN
ncbi:CLUMA_CG006731, isoform A [Clunio marinus]|uniref:CLUMA_CG006731, isoform A n=1 Tax=Clunio marinus TaxID=568069 RepID=A0A1J1HZ03_9DIPT|nr:CLUMA_CG006731, isoform A [Clunio marinus]